MGMNVTVFLTNTYKTTMETKEELLARHAFVKNEVDENRAKLDKMKLGQARTRKAMWGGCLTFTLLQIESEMRERGYLDG